MTPGLEFEISGHRYRAGRLSAREQFHIVRRIGTVVSAIGVVLEHAGDILNAPFAKVEPVLKALGAMSDADADYVLTACLAVVERYDAKAGAGTWFKVQSPDGALMYHDIELPQLAQILWHVLAGNLRNFFSVLPSGSKDGEEAAETGSPFPAAKTGSGVPS